MNQKFVPLASNTKFSGLMSLWMTPLAWRYSNPVTMHATKNSS